MQIDALIQRNQFPLTETVKQQIKEIRDHLACLVQGAIKVVIVRENYYLIVTISSQGLLDYSVQYMNGTISENHPFLNQNGSIKEGNRYINIGGDQNKRVKENVDMLDMLLHYPLDDTSVNEIEKLKQQYTSNEIDTNKFKDGVNDLVKSIELTNKIEAVTSECKSTARMCDIKEVTSVLNKMRENNEITAEEFKFFMDVLRSN